MKRIENLIIILIFLSLSGCWTKIYLGKEKEPEKILSDDAVMSSRAIDPTTVPAGGTWGTVRGIINTNFSNINGTLDSVEVTIANHGDSITAHRTAIDGKLSLTDTAAMLSKYALTSELSDAEGVVDSSIFATRYYVGDALSGYAQKVDTTAQTRVAYWASDGKLTGSPNFTYGSNYFYLKGAVRFGGLDSWRNLGGHNARSVRLINRRATPDAINFVLDGAGTGTGLLGVNDSIVAITLGNGNPSIKFSVESTFNKSHAPLYTIPSTSYLSGFRLPHGIAPTEPVDGDIWTTTNGLFTQTNGSTDTLATQAYARQYGGSGTIVMADVQNELADSLVNYVAVKDSTGIKPGSYVSGYTFQQGMINKISVSDTAAMLASYKRRLDSIADVLADSVNIETLLQVDLSTDTLATKAYARSVGGESVSGITLNGGSLTLTGDAGTADDVTFYTNGNGQYDLPAGGGNLTIMSQVQGWISDSVNVLRTADSDTIPLFVFGAGSGSSADTALFNNGRFAGAFYNSGSDTLYVTELRGVLVEGTGTETIAVQVSWDVNMKDATPTNLNTAALTVTSMTSGTADTAFDNNGIPPGVWVWCSLSGASANNKPTMLTLTMTGYRRNRAY